MHRLSLEQALSLWSDLEAAYYRRHSFGTDTAEIYMYRLMPMSPGFREGMEQLRAGNTTHIFAQDARDVLRAANEALHAILLHFSREQDALIEIERHVLSDQPQGSWQFVELGDWLRVAEFDHRVHVRVTPR